MEWVLTGCGGLALKGVSCRPGMWDRVAITRTPGEWVQPTPQEEEGCKMQIEMIFFKVENNNPHLVQNY